MKRYKILRFALSIFLIFFSLMLFSACELEDSDDKQPLVTEEKEIIDGLYTGFSNAGEDGSYAWAQVTVENQKIKDVELMEITEKGNEKDYDTYKYEPSVKAYQEMPQRFVEANSADVDLYTGATNSSVMFQTAVERALDYARGGLEGIFYEGDFQGESRRTDYGYAVAIVNVMDDKLRNIELKEINAEGNWIDYDEYDWEAAEEASEEMAERFVEANSTRVDLYTNATQSSIRFQEAVRNALKHARKDPDRDIE